MLINLIENAIKYNRHGGSVNVSVFNNEKTVNMLISGQPSIGIPEERPAPGFSSGFTVWTRAAPGRWAARGWGWPSSSTFASNIGAMIDGCTPSSAEGTSVSDHLSQRPSAGEGENARPGSGMGTSGRRPGRCAVKALTPFIKLRAAGKPRRFRRRASKNPARFFDAKESGLRHPEIPRDFRAVC
jgi:hypothetical protein